MEKHEKKKIRILYTIPNFNTAGSGKALINVISRIDKSKFEPCICCRHERGDLFNTAKALNIPIYISEFSAPMKPRLKGMESVIKLTAFFKKIGPDIIHSYNYSDDYSEGLAAKFSGIKWIYTKKNMGWGSNAWRIRTKLANAIIPQNQEMVDVFFNNIEKYSLIPIGIDLNEFSGLKRDEEMAEKYDLNSAYPVILTIANIIPIKGIHFLIKGFSLINEDFKNPKLLIVGEDKTEYADNLKDKVKEMGLDKRIIFTGKQNNIKSFFSVADLFILSSMKTGEGGPISVLEAMASSVLSYGSNVPGIRDQFREFQDQLFESENPGSIANKVLHFANMDEAERKSRIAKQLEFVRNNYSIENEIKRLQQLYFKVYKADKNTNLNFEESI
jgi:glycosyltransferase involved in cell wall biosynthesis